MLRLDDFAPTGHERLTVAAYPEQVAIGYLRAWRKADGDKRSDGRPLFDFDKQPSASNLFDLFKKPGER